MQWGCSSLGRMYESSCGCIWSGRYPWRGQFWWNKDPMHLINSWRTVSDQSTSDRRKRETTYCNTCNTFCPNIMSHPRIIPQGATMSCSLCVLDWVNFACAFFDLVAEGSCGTSSDLGVSAVTQPFGLMVNFSSSLSNIVCHKRACKFDSEVVGWIMTQACSNHLCSWKWDCPLSWWSFSISWCSILSQVRRPSMTLFPQSNGAKIIKWSMGGAEAALSTMQRDMTIMLATTGVINADTVCHNDGTFSIACYVALVRVKQLEVCLHLLSRSKYHCTQLSQKCVISDWPAIHGHWLRACTRFVRRSLWSPVCLTIQYSSCSCRQ